MLQGKQILLGVTGGIAAYKAALLTRELMKEGAVVKVAMTENATRFIAPLTFQTLTASAVAVDTFSAPEEWEIGHISLAEWARLMVIAPATANFIGKIAGGIADDLLTTCIMAAQAPVLVCPAMNTNMYRNRIVQDNIHRLTEYGYSVMEPDAGELACGAEGPGRLPTVEGIIEEAASILTEKDLRGHCIIVTAGPTREALDPVRFISNHSSGKMGYALALMARRRGARVILISGPTDLAAPRGLTFIPVSTAMEMKDCVMENLKEATIIIKAAAVADYRPLFSASQKIKKQDGTLSLELVRNPDIISEIAELKGNRIVVGFAMETENLVENAERKLKAKGMDLIVANDLNMAGAGFRTDTNIVKIIDSAGTITALPLMDKRDVADRILSRARELFDERRQ
ncbi:MAG: bifunctional phosphopantothenoylcysteine decarboxylase/phosphopantothenate--cysteine ligase CoaBC [Deltaproteobacteria bacterium]|nr:bifunctional phosphopantothenoylcysteine decarboxylase/phosphopantothenate--cysteine ligase CoaBC [Deltaproteobacteria bacterium]